MAVGGLLVLVENGVAWKDGRAVLSGQTNRPSVGVVGRSSLPSGNADKGQEQRNTYPITPVAGIVALALRDKVLHRGVDGFGIALALALGGRPWCWRYLKGNLLCNTVLWLVGWIGGCSDVEAKGWMVDCGSLVRPSMLWRQASLVGVGFLLWYRVCLHRGAKGLGYYFFTSPSFTRIYFALHLQNCIDQLPGYMYRCMGKYPGESERVIEDVCKALGTI